MGKFVDETGNTYGYWTVLGREANVNHSAMWKCVCKCGNIGIISGTSLRRGNSRSCGCLQKEIAKTIKYKDLSGQQFGRLYVCGECGKSGDKIVWECVCECGNTVRVTTDSLKTGHTRSCGCLQRETASKNQTKNLLGLYFGSLRVEEKLGINENHQMEWMCICDCGNHKVVTSVDLIHGRVISCGCSKSSGEQSIQMWLEKQNIPFEKEKRFYDCRDKRPLPFDFYLPNVGEHGACIEFDGVQHYQESKLYSRNIPLDDRVRRDNYKTEYCKQNNIRLLRIPYWEKDNIESILNDWLFLNDTEEANSSDVDLSA